MFRLTRSAARPDGAATHGADVPSRRVTGDEGAAVLEFALVLPLLVLFGLVTADVGRAYQLRNRLSGAAREGAAVAQFLPSNFDTSCGVGSRTIEGNAVNEDPSLASSSGFTVTEQRRQPNGTLGAVVTTCPTGTNLPVPGDRVIVTVSSELTLLTPIAEAVIGTETLTVSAKSEVVVQ
jgi:Flp pilus assembly protein TadG